MASMDFGTPGGSMGNMSYVDAGNSASSFVAAAVEARGYVFVFTGVSALSSVLVGKSGSAMGIGKYISNTRVDYLCVAGGGYMAIGQVALASPYTVTIKWKSY